MNAAIRVTAGDDGEITVTGTTGTQSIHLDVYPYGEEEDGRTLALWVVVMSRGPAVGTLAGRFGESECEESLILESEDLFNESEIDAKLGQLHRTRTLCLPMRLLSYYSDLGAGSGWIDILGDCLEMTICLDEFDDLAVEAPLMQVDDWAEFGGRTIASRMSAPRSLPHEDWRLLNLLCGVSRSLRDHLESELNDARMDMLPPSVTGSAIRRWVPVRENRLADRAAILESLRRSNAVFTRKQIGIILASEAKWAMDDAGNFERAEAKRETVSSLITGARIKPKHSNRFSSLDITQKLIPFAATRRSWGLRYEELRDELRELGIFVPDEPITK